MSAAAASAAWRRIDGARPLIAWSEAQLAALTRELQRACEAWCEGWGLPQEMPCVRCGAASAKDCEGAWQLAGVAGAATGWIELPPSFDAWLARALWDSDGALGPIATSVVQACRADLEEKLRAALRLEAADPLARQRPPPSGPWSGLVAATLGPGVGLLLDAPAVEGVLRSVAPQLVRPAHAPGAPPALTPVALAVECLRMPLHVELSACELDVASLEDLRIGDVVPVPHRLDAPLLVRDAQEETLFGGYLAQRGGRKALALAAACVAGHPAP